MKRCFIDMDIDVIRTYIAADPSTLEYIKSMLEYRDLRTEQAYYSKLAYLYDYKKFDRGIPKEVSEAGEFDRSYWKERIIALDKARRRTHNQALGAFDAFIRIGEKHHLDYIYIGDRLTAKEASAYERPEVRTQITDAMLQLLNSIEENVTPLNSDDKLHDVKRNMNQFNRSYSVSESLSSDESKEEDGGIVFDLKNIIDFKNNENL